MARVVFDAPHPHLAAAAEAPSSASSSPPAPVDEEETPDGAGEAEVILVIDDNRLVRESLIMMLEDLGYAILEAETAQQALAVLDSTAEIDAALVDFRLPDMNGVELAGKLRERRPNLRMVIVSGQQVDQDVLLRIPGPPVGMLMKPFNAAQLENLLSDAWSEH